MASSSFLAIVAVAVLVNGSTAVLTNGGLLTCGEQCPIGCTTNANAQAALKLCATSLSTAISGAVGQSNCTTTAYVDEACAINTERNHPHTQYHHVKQLHANVTATMTAADVALGAFMNCTMSCEEKCFVNNCAPMTTTSAMSTLIQWEYCSGNKAMLEALANYMTCAKSALGSVASGRRR